MSGAAVTLVDAVVASGVRGVKGYMSLAKGRIENTPKGREEGEGGDIEGEGMISLCSSRGDRGKTAGVIDDNAVAAVACDEEGGGDRWCIIS